MTPRRNPISSRAKSTRTSAKDALQADYAKAISSPHDVEEASPDATNTRPPSPITVLVKNITLNPNQPRRYFDAEKHKQLVESIRLDGILQPLLVRPKKKGYELVAGERRYRAAKELGLTEVPVTVRELSDTEARQFALVENLQREELNPIDETEGILALLEMRLEREREEVIALLNKLSKVGRGLADNDIRLEESEAVNAVFASVGRLTPESFRVNRLPLLNLPEDVLDALRAGKIEYTKAKVIAQVKDDDARGHLLEEALEQALSLSEIRDRVKALKATTSVEAPAVETIRKRANRVARLVKDKELEDDAKRQEVDKLLARIEKLLS